jgi:hypothetical protein
MILDRGLQLFVIRLELAMARAPEQYFELVDGEEIKVSCIPAMAA